MGDTAKVANVTCILLCASSKLTQKNIDNAIEIVEKINRVDK